MSNLSLEDLDANLLYGIVNEKLRTEGTGFDEFLLKYDVNKQQFESKMEQAGYYYDLFANQLKPK